MPANRTEIALERNSAAARVRIDALFTWARRECSKVLDLAAWRHCGQFGAGIGSKELAFGRCVESDKFLRGCGVWFFRICYSPGKHSCCGLWKVTAAVLRAATWSSGHLDSPSSCRRARWINSTSLSLMRVFCAFYLRSLVPLMRRAV